MKSITTTVIALASVGAGALITIQLVQRGVISVRSASSSQTVVTPTIPIEPAASAQPSPEDIVVSIPQDALERMRLSFARAQEETPSVELRVPGTVQANAYRDVRVTSLVGGVVTKVPGELGQTVKRGEPLASLFSRELAEAQAEFIGFQSQLEAEHKKLVRTQELVNLGAASRQELEDVEASHQVHTAHLEEARQKLLLLGLSQAQIEEVRFGHKVSSEIAVPAPADGIVTARSLNAGQVVSMGQELFTITDLSSVWVEGNVLEDDFGTVTKSSRVTMNTPAYPNRDYRGVVEYVDPRVDSQTRTAKVRVVVDNHDLALRLGMYVDMHFLRAGLPAVVVPAQAIQMIGPRSVVYVPIEKEPGRFRQLMIVAGAESGTGRQIAGKLKPGQLVVTDGSFLLRSEALRQHPQ
jgi:RND family efflux transporter MFP subunit